MGILQVEKNGELIDVLEYKETTSPRGARTLLINNDFLLKKLDYVIFMCDESSEIIRQQFRFKDKWFKDKIYKDSIQMKRTNLERYGVENVYQSKEVKEKIKQSNLGRYGKKDIGQFGSPEHKKSIITKYGFDNPMKNSKVQKKVKQTNLKKYGVENVYQSKAIKDKIKQTNLEKHGETCSLKNKKVREKMEKTNLERYGFKYFVQTKEFSETIKDNKIYISKLENEIKNFIASLDVSFNSNDRSIIGPQELDIYIPEHNIAVEFNGLYWHSDLYKDKWYHIKKTKACEEKGIRLIHIYEDEWLFRQEIVKARLKNLLGKNSRRIGARKTTIKEIEPKIKNTFLDAYHIQGKDGSAVKLGAFYEDELIGVMTFSKPRLFMNQRNKKEGIWELSRFATVADTYTPGLASKMLKHFEKNYNPVEIYSYADRRWSQGGLYRAIGFEFDSETNPNYYYCENRTRYHRYKFRKSELKKFFDHYSDDKTEFEIMDEAGYLRIYDCGNYKFVKTF